MRQREWWKRAVRCVTAVALLAAFAPVQAFAATRSVSVQDFKRGGLRAARAIRMADDTTGPTFSIKGTVHHTGGDWPDASIAAVPFSLNASGTWDPIDGSPVAADGSYSIDGLPAGTYRVGFLDSKYVYADRYYHGASAVDSGVDVTVVNKDVANIDDTVTALPERSIAGRVHYSGADPSYSSVNAEFYTFDATSSEWQVEYSIPVEADGSFKIHPETDGTYRIGFTDFNGGFGDVFYANAKTVGTGKSVKVVAGSPVAGIDQTMTALPSTRIGGSDGIATAVKISQATYPDMAGGTVVLCTGDNWPDSLAAGSYAYAVDGPMLLTHKTYLPASVLTEIARLSPEQVVIIGSTAAVDLDVEMAIRETGVPTVRRLQGKDRYQTAVQVARELINKGLVGNGDGTTDFAIATGANFADGVSGSPVAATMHMPVLLVQQNAAPASVLSLVASTFTPSADTTANEAQLLVFGGENVVGTPVVNAIAAAGHLRADAPGDFAADNVTRLWGTDRYSTAAAIADFAVAAGFCPRAAAVADGLSYNEGLAAGPMLAKRQQPLLLTAPTLATGSDGGYHLSAATEAYLTKNAGDLARLTAIGGTKVLSNNVFNAALYYGGISTTAPTGH